MNRYQAGPSCSQTIAKLALIALAAAMVLAGPADDADDINLRAQAYQQARQAAQPDTWPKLVAEGCAMVACDRMRK